MKAYIVEFYTFSVCSQLMFQINFVIFFIVSLFVIIMSVLQAVNALPLNTDATAAQYATYLIKFSDYVG